MDGYRDANEAAQLRITTLEAKLREKAAAVDARDAEVAELARRLKRIEGAQRRPRWYSAALIGSLLAALTGSAFLVVHLSDALVHRSEAQRRTALAEKEREIERAGRVAAEAELADLRGAMAAQRLPAADAAPDPSEQVEGDGTLVAIAIGGACEFTVDGEVHGERSSLRLQLPTGRHTVSCKPRGTAMMLQTQSVLVREGRPGIASFRLN